MPDAMVRVMCPNLRCRSVLAVPSEARGRMVRCKSCGMNVLVPKKQEAQPSAPAEAAGGKSKSKD